VKGVLISGAVALIEALLGTPMFIRFLVKRGYGQFIRDDGPTSHHTKRGTPTMGGAIILGAVLVAYLAAHLATLQLPTMSALLVLFLIGLPFLILFAVVLALLGAVFGVLMAFAALGFVVLKVALLVLIPVLIIGWIVRRVMGPSDGYRLRV